MEKNTIPNKKIIAFLDKNKQRWAQGLTYMADKKLDDQFKTAETHLNIILNEIKNYIET